MTMIYSPNYSQWKSSRVCWCNQMVFHCYAVMWSVLSAFLHILYLSDCGFLIVMLSSAFAAAIFSLSQKCMCFVFLQYLPVSLTKLCHLPCRCCLYFCNIVAWRLMFAAVLHHVVMLCKWYIYVWHVVFISLWLVADQQACGILIFVGLRLWGEKILDSWLWVQSQTPTPGNVWHTDCVLKVDLRENLNSSSKRCTIVYKQNFNRELNWGKFCNNKT